jgi:hypothetical protein
MDCRPPSCPESFVCPFAVQIYKYVLKWRDSQEFSCYFECLRTHSLTHSLTPWLTVLLEKLTGFQLVNKFPAFYGTRRLITAFTSARHLSQSDTVHAFTSLFPKIHLNSSSHLRLGLPVGLFPSGFPTKIVYTTLLSPILTTCPAYLIIVVWMGVKLGLSH